MLRWLSNNIFAVNRVNQFSASRFNHCSTIQPLQKGILLGWYSGSRECDNDQSVHVAFVDGQHHSEFLRVGDCTGNPVLVPANDEVVLLWSKFEDNNDCRRLADRWKTCSLWLQKIGVVKGKVQLIGEKVQLAKPEQHLLGRCNPIIHNGRTLLPLYDEVERQCVIYEGNGLEFKQVSRYGIDVIQPTLWASNNKVCSLTRNFTPHANRALYCQSEDGKNWSDGTRSNLLNVNNSLHVVNWKGMDVVLWNNENGRWRRNMTLGVLSEETIGGFLQLTAEPVEVVGAKHGSYPSMCVDSDGNLNFTFTNAERKIEHHVWNIKSFRSRRGDSSRRSGRGDGDYPKLTPEEASVL